MGTRCVLGVESGNAAAMEPAASNAAAGRSVEATLPPAHGRRVAPLRVIAQLLLDLPMPAWIVIDAVIIWLAMVQGYRWFEVAGMSHHAQAWFAYVVFAVALVVCSLIFGLNERTTLVSRWHIVTRMVLTTVLSVVVAYAFLYVIMYMRLSRRVAALTVGSYLVFGTSFRLFACYAVHRLKRRVLIVGVPKACASFVDRLQDGLLQHHEVVGFVHNPGQEAIMRNGLLTTLGTTADIVPICRRMNVNDIVVCNGSAENPEVMTWMLPCLRLGCRVTNEATFYETSVGQILVDEITPDWFLFSDLKAHCDEYATVKRIFDVVVAAIGLIVSAPFYPLVALAIKLEDGGAVLYSQDRVGRNGAVFKLYKFRTMKIDAKNGENVWAARNDPRVTHVGRLLRRTRIDEIPQFYNIFVGHMSVVGPRPEQPAIATELCRRVPLWSERNLVKPGLTGWAQISFRYGNTVEDAKRKLQFDFYYLKHMSLELDVIILFRTLGTFLRGAC